MILKDDQCPMRKPKAINRADAHIDRTIDYRKWRRSLAQHMYGTDIDIVEWRVVDGEIKPILVLELTRLDEDGPKWLSPKYLDAIIHRFTKRDGQGKAITTIAGLIGVDAIIVLFRQDLSEFWLYNLSNPTEQGWHHMLKERYGHWLSTHDGRRHV